MKMLLVILSSIIGSSVYAANEKSCDALLASPAVFSEVLSCKVTSINGAIISFVPPKVGEQIVIDASQSTIQSLEFDQGGVISVLIPLFKTTHPETASYIAYFQAQQYETPTERESLTLMVGKFRDEKGQDIRRGTIQSILLEKHTGLTRTSEIELDCNVIK